MKPFTILSVLFMLILISIVAVGQQSPSILLSGHTFSKGNSKIGTLNLNSGRPATFRLKGRNAHLFVLKGNNLSIKNNLISAAEKWYDIDIEAIDSSIGKVLGRFRIVKDQFAQNKVIAHRGAWKNTGAAENSISSLQHAIELGCQGSEFDVHMSADSVLFIHHDDAIENKKIASIHSSELKAMKLSNGESLPTLEEYLREGLKQNTTKLVLEIKPTINIERALQMTRKVEALVKELKAQAWVDYISFDYNICLELLRLDPFVRVAYLNGDKSPTALAADKLWGLDYHFNVLKKNEGWIDEAKQMRLTLNAWTVNDPEMLKWFLDKKIDFITTNEPELLLKLIKQ